MTETVQWMADGTPYSPRFGDRYHSEAAHALSQAEQVFLAGCGLPQAWAGHPQWRILETGFGFGLNFLVTWHAWQQDPARPGLLHFVSTEAFPIAAADLLAQARKFPHLLPLAEELAAQWWGLLPGVHRLRLAGGRLLLSLLIGDSQAMLRQQELVADSIYLDGFSPARNPDMWSLHSLKAVARCARRGTQLATWTIAAQLRRDLAQCGFAVRKVPGVPPKRDNLQATFAPQWEPRKAPLWPLGAQALPARLAGGGGHAAIVGAGIAGAACARQLALRGWQVTVLDTASHPAAGASALPAGIFAPHTSSDDSPLSRITRAGQRCSLQWAQQLLQAGQDWEMTGVLERRQLATPPDETAALSDSPAAVPTRRSAHERPPAWKDALAAPAADWSEEASAATLEALGLPADTPALWHPRGGWLRPAALVQALLDHPGIHFVGDAQVQALDALKTAEGQPLWSLSDGQGQQWAQADLVVLCAGPQSASIRINGQSLAAAQALQTIRGQVSWGRYAEGQAPAAHQPVNGHGSWVPYFRIGQDADAAWVMGSSFERGQSALPPSAEDAAAAHAGNGAKLQTLLPEGHRPDAQAFARAQHWAQLRCASTDRLPLVGPLLPTQALQALHTLPEGLASPWVATAMGSRGLTWALLCAELLAARLHAEPLPLPNPLALALASDRYCK
ncbi:FAD-dependent 5-carboxymethylaminomethyl-2-thiouridine(34) oxidoreductase MnmC [Comamonas squillarum]|uniref:tRNA 5-methylaminomethyl-2-thiouridine biosynthesis bifunctional protein MnmC n=1 Tax=Comamonas squillarum TaxID=2977320 RepID=A0ABY5ZZS0_9BURK|nr:FAD-dependent 5-carboxymethylaminomethyl-2-thiouridine(34) oxidoreductase MnmC [Comamonas sp. PR12]UXC19510.1 FAD-dependent 5-carboxymethylaminomethyl-2-thiouridine(34) oxidoreductase MnmC [Comamonas sp. PR12]